MGVPKGDSSIGLSPFFFLSFLSIDSLRSLHKILKILLQYYMKSRRKHGSPLNS